MAHDPDFLIDPPASSRCHTCWQIHRLCVCAPAFLAGSAMSTADKYQKLIKEATVPGVELESVEYGETLRAMYKLAIPELRARGVFN